MELDRFYPLYNTAFEFNGPQHYGPTELFSAEDAAKQRGRDLIKVGICLIKDITLLAIHPEDLTLQVMQQKVGSRLPLRDLRGHDLLINYLESVSRSYRQAARRKSDT